MKILIVGGGVSSVSLLNHIVHHKNFNKSVHIDIIDEEEHMGRGQPYIEDDQHLLMNIPRDQMDIGAGEISFKTWIEEQNIESKRFMSRKHFGDYLSSVLNKIINAHKNINVHYGQLTEINRVSDYHYEAILNGQTIEYDYVFLGIGQLEYSDPYQLKGEKNFYYDPNPLNEKLKNFNDKEVGIIGSGLSAIDCIRYLFHNNKTEKIYLFSKSGNFPSVRGDFHEFKFKYFTMDCINEARKNNNLTLKFLIDLFKQEAEYQNVDLSILNRKTDDVIHDIQYDLDNKDKVGKLQYFIGTLDQIIPKFFLHLTNEDKTTFLEQYHSLIDENHSPMPDIVGEQLIEWIQKGKLKVIDNTQEIVSVNGHSHFRVVDDKGTFNLKSIINATGPKKDITQSNKPLIKHMYNHHLITVCPYGGIYVDDDNQVISGKYGTLKGLYLIGALSFTKDYMSNMVTLLVQHTVNISNQIME